MNLTLKEQTDKIALAIKRKLGTLYGHLEEKQ